MYANYRFVRGLLLTVAIASVGSSSYADPGIYQHVLRSTAFIYHEYSDGRDRVMEWGSGALIDADNRLVLTNEHVVHNVKEVKVSFSAYDDRGELVTDPNTYTENFTTLRAAGIAMTGRVVAIWKEKDLALVQLPQLPIEAQVLPLASSPMQPGENVHSVGNSGLKGGCLWRYTRGIVRNSYRCPESKIHFLEIDSAVNRGDSGGPLVNDRGELAGIVKSYDKLSRSVSQAVDLRDVRSLLTWYTSGHFDGGFAASSYGE